MGICKIVDMGGELVKITITSVGFEARRWGEGVLPIFSMYIPAPE